MDKLPTDGGTVSKAVLPPAPGPRSEPDTSADPCFQFKRLKGCARRSGKTGKRPGGAYKLYKP